MSIRGLALSLLLSTYPTLVLADSGVAAAPAREGNRREGVVLRNCRILLIEHATLAADRAGIVASIVPEEGDGVAAGSTIVTLADDVPKAALAVAAKQSENDIEVRYASKAAEVAQAEYERALRANQRLSGTVPEIEIRRLQLAADRAVLQIEQAAHQLKISRLQLGQAAAELSAYRVTAPFDGIVTRVLRSRGEAVRQGDPIIEVVGTRRIRVEAEAELNDGLLFKPGLPVEVHLDMPGLPKDVTEQTFHGKLKFVDVTAQPISGRIRIWAEVENVDNRLRAGLTARMRVVTAPPDGGAQR